VKRFSLFLFYFTCANSFRGKMSERLFSPTEVRGQRWIDLEERSAHTEAQ